MPALDLPEKQFLTSDASVVSFQEYGFGKITLLVHGSLCDYRYWRWQMAALGEYGRVVAPSLRSYWPAPAQTRCTTCTVNRHAQDLVELASALSPDEAVNVVGHSRGAHVAMEMALMAPDRVSALVLADPGMNLAGISNNRSFITLAARAIEQGDPESGLATFIDAVSGENTWRRMTGWFKTMTRDNAHTLLWQSQEAGIDIEAARYQAIDCPVLLLGGQQSPPRYKQIIDALQGQFAKASRDIIPMASHGMNLANPKTFNRKVLEFLNQTETV